MNAAQCREVAAALRMNAPSADETIAAQVDRIDKALALPLNLLAGSLQIPVLAGHPTLEATDLAPRLEQIYRDRGFETMLTYPEGVVSLYLSW